MTNTSYADLSKISGDLFRKAADTARRMGCSLSKAEKALNRTERKLKNWPRLKTTMIAILATIGFPSGMLVAIAEMLRRHGPTVTLWGTVCATLIYIGVGALISLAFGLMGKLWSNQIKNDLEEKQVNLREEISSLKSKIEEAYERAESLSYLSVADSYNAALQS